MPERKTFRGHEVKNARRIVTNGKPFIRVTYVGNFGQPGTQVDVTPDDYDKELKRSFVPGSRR